MYVCNPLWAVLSNFWYKSILKNFKCKKAQQFIYVYLRKNNLNAVKAKNKSFLFFLENSVFFLTHSQINLMNIINYIFLLLFVHILCWSQANVPVYDSVIIVLNRCGWRRKSSKLFFNTSDQHYFINIIYCIKYTILILMCFICILFWFFFCFK